MEGIFFFLKIFWHTLRTSVVYLKTKTLRYLECSFFHLLIRFLGVMKGLSLYVEGRRPSFLFARPRPREIFHNKGSVLGRHNRNLFQVPRTWVYFFGTVEETAAGEEAPFSRLAGIGNFQKYEAPIRVLHRSSYSSSMTRLNFYPRLPVLHYLGFFLFSEQGLHYPYGPVHLLLLGLRYLYGPVHLSSFSTFFFFRAKRL